MPSEPQSPNTYQIRDSPTELLVSWDSPLEPNGIITSYRVYCYETHDSSGGGESDLIEELAINFTTAVVPGNTTEAVVTELTPYTFYACYVTANTSVGEGNASDSDSARTDESGNCVTMDNFNMLYICCFFLLLFSPSNSSRNYKCKRN